MINKESISVWSRNISASYNNNKVLENINLILPSKNFISIIGPNGAGKSTFFYLLIGKKRPLSGNILIFGESINKQCQKHNIAYVPQQEEIDWNYPISVWNVVLGGRYGHMSSEKGLKRFYPPAWSDKKHKQAAKEALKAVNMLSYRNNPVKALSGGQKKRVFLGRALAQKASLLLLDEPLVGIDKKSEILILEVLEKLKNKGKTILMITHNLEKIRNYTDIAILINKTVIAAGSPEDIAKMNNLKGAL